MSDYFQSTQYAQVYHNELEHELTVIFDLKCISRTKPATCDGPAEEPRFEMCAPIMLEDDSLTSVHQSSPVTWAQLCVILSQEIAQELYNKAVAEAEESGDF